MNVKHLPNIISGLRMAFILPYGIFLWKDSHGTAAFFFALGIILSDKLDGTLARILKAESKVGAILDALSDGIFIFVTLIILFLTKTLSLSDTLFFILPRAITTVSHGIYFLINGRINEKHYFGNKIAGLGYFIAILWIIAGMEITQPLAVSFIATMSCAVLFAESKRHKLFHS